MNSKDNEEDKDIFSFVYTRNNSTKKQKQVSNDFKSNVDENLD